MKKFTKKQKLIIGAIVALIIAIITTIILFKFSFTGVAATVENHVIMESQVTEQIEKTRKGLGLEDDATWYSYLKQNNIDTKTIRNTTLENLITNEAVSIIAEEHDISVTDDDVNNEFNTTKQQYSTEEWQSALTENGLTEDDLKEQCKSSLLSEKVTEYLVNQEQYPDELYKEFFTNYGSKINGSTGYYQLCYPEGSEAQAQEMYNKIQKGEISFEEAAKQLTAADSTGLNFDYVIYDCFIQNAQELTDAINQTEVGQMSTPVKTSTGYTYIVKVVDKASCPSVVTSFDQLDEPTREYVQNYANVLVKISYGQNAIKYAMQDMKIHRYEMPFKTSYSKSIFG